MKFNCVYFDDEMSLSKEVRLTRDQLATFDVDVKDLSYGFVIRGRSLADLPKGWEFIMENSIIENIIWKEFIHNGTLWLIGISYNL